MTLPVDLRKTPHLDITTLHTNEDVAILVDTVVRLIAKYIELWNKRQLRRHQYAYSSTWDLKGLRAILEGRGIDTSNLETEDAGRGYLSVTMNRREVLAEIILRQDFDPTLDEIKADLREYGVNIKRYLDDARYWAP